MGALQVIAGVDWHLFQESFVDEQLLVVTLFVKQFWGCKCPALKLMGLLLNLDVPLLPLLHLKQLLYHRCDRFHFLLRVLLDFIQKIPHRLWVVSDLIWHAIKQTELGDQTNFPSVLIRNQHWLSFVCDLEVVLLEMVLGYRDLCAISELEEC